MKLRYNAIGYPYFNTVTGHIQPGHYDCDSIIKIAEMAYEGKRINPQLLPTYNKGSKFSLKRKHNIAGYRVIFYGRLFNEENYSLLRKHCFSLPKTEAMKFISNHIKEIAEVFKTEKDFEYYILKLFFELGRNPYEFEITYKGQIVDLNSAKTLWEKDKESFGLLTYLRK